MKQSSLNQFKLRYYCGEVRDLKDHMGRLLAHRAGANQVTLGFLDALESEYEVELTKLKVKVRMLTPAKEGEVKPYISPEQIAMAKLRPIRDFLNVGRDKKTVCIFHNDKHASLHVYDTRYYCFSCNASGDPIDIVMKLKNCSFTQAVRFLIS